MELLKYITSKRKTYLILYQMKAKHHSLIYVGGLKMKISRQGTFLPLLMLKDRFKIGILHLENV